MSRPPEFRCASTLRLAFTFDFQLSTLLHSYRNATIGSTPVARFAGNNAAPSAAITTAAAAAT